MYSRTDNDSTFADGGERARKEVTEVERDVHEADEPDLLVLADLRERIVDSFTIPQRRLAAAYMFLLLQHDYDMPPHDAVQALSAFGTRSAVYNWVSIARGAGGWALAKKPDHAGFAADHWLFDFLPIQEHFRSVCEPLTGQ